MTSRVHILHSFIASLVLWSLGAEPSGAGAPSTIPEQGIRKHVPQMHALTGARIVVAPGHVIEQGTVMIDRGVILQVGAQVDIPVEARRWDLSGHTLYPGFVDAYGTADLSPSAGDKGAPYWNRNVTPQFSVANQYQTDNDSNKKYRSQGITTRLVAPGKGIIRGTSALVSMGKGLTATNIVATDVALHCKLTIQADWHRKEYPNSPMGAVALARQAMHDATWYREAWRAYSVDTTLPMPEWNDALRVLHTYLDSNQLVMIEASDEQFLLRADDFAREFGMRAVIVGSGKEYQRLAEVRTTNRSVIVPVNFPKAPHVATPEMAIHATLEQLLHWDLAPDNPAKLVESGVKIALTAHGLKDPATFLEKARLAVARGLPADEALRALTETPSEMLGVSDRLGSLRPGKMANILVADGDLFDEETKLLQTWVHGQRYEVEERSKYDLRKTWQLSAIDQGAGSQGYLLELKGEPTALTGSLRIADQTETADDVSSSSELQHVVMRGERLGFVIHSKPFGHDGMAQVSLLIISEGTNEQDKTLSLQGDIVWPDGSRAHLRGEPLAMQVASGVEVSADDTVAPSSANVDAEDQESNEHEATDDEGKDQPKPTLGESSALFEVNYPLGAFGRNGAPAPPKNIVFQNATIWTCAEAGILKSASLHIEKGEILAIGHNLVVPHDAVVVDASGWHITPGIIDCHSHMATDGGINESGQAITAEVRVGDFVDAKDINIYRQLAGGVTVANILHGSANPIGGQNQVIKLRWGESYRNLKFTDAPQGIKFALGENVKQSNWGDAYRSRYPQTRMGVEQIFRDTFRAATKYRRRWEDWQQNHRGLPPRVDLELQAVAEILAGERWIHCHAYRQDEMLTLLRVLEEFGVTIGTFQHVLEGYKIADALSRHGAMGSAFSDWWAYKYEVFDAIPYNGALMFQMGVNVSFNSDSAELARHLNQEAAKAIKYGGVPAEEALKFVTINPAKQLRIEQFVGSLEPGKHADLAMWNGSPLSNFTRCQQTWIEGRKYFDAAADRQERLENRRRHAALVQKILKLDAPMFNADDVSKDDSTHYPREDAFCHPHHAIQRSLRN